MAAVELDDAGRDAVEKRPVVGDGHHAALEVDQQLLEPLDRVEVQVVGGLVEQEHVRRGDQRLRQRHPLARAAREVAHAGLRIQVQAVQGFVDALLPVPGVEGFDLRLQRVEVGAFRGGQILVAQGHDMRQAGAGGLEDGGVGVERRFLGHIGDAKPCLQLQRAVVGFFEAAEDLEERGFAGAVAADEADALGLEQGEVRVVEQRHVAEGQLRIEESDESHVGQIIPGRLWRARSPGDRYLPGGATHPSCAELPGRACSPHRLFNSMEDECVRGAKTGIYWRARLTTRKRRGAERQLEGSRKQIKNNLMSLQKPCHNRRLG